MRFLDWLTGKVRETPTQGVVPAAGKFVLPSPRRPARVQDLSLGFVRLDFDDQTCLVLDRDMYEYSYGDRHLPDPLQRDLDAVLRNATRVRVLAAGVRGGKAIRSSVLLDTSEPSLLEELGACLEIRGDPESFGHCGCRGGPTMQLFDGAEHLATIGLQHGDAIRWNAWHHDAALREGARLTTWLKQHGVYPVLLEKLYQNPLPWSGRFDLDGTPTPLSRTRQRVLLAQILILTAEYPGALAECDAALAEQPDLGEAYAMRAVVYRRSGNFELSLIDCHQAIELFTGQRRATAYRERAEVYHDLRQFAKAFADCSESIAINPVNPEALNFRGGLHMGFGRLDQAQADLAAASEMDPGWVCPPYNRAIAAFHQSDWSTAVEVGTRAIALLKAAEMPDKDNLATMYWNRGAALEKLGDSVGAEADRREALVLNPSFDARNWSLSPKYRVPQQ